LPFLKVPIHSGTDAANLLGGYATKLRRLTLPWRVPPVSEKLTRAVSSNIGQLTRARGLKKNNN